MRKIIQFCCEKREHFPNILEHSKTAYLSQVIEDNSQDQKSLSIHANKIMYKQKEAPLSEHVSPKSLAKDLNQFFLNKSSDKMQQAFSTNSLSAFENDTPFNDQTFTEFRDLTEKDIILIIISSKPKTS